MIDWVLAVIHLPENQVTETEKCCHHDGEPQVPDSGGKPGPQPVKKRQRRVTVIDEKIIPLYAKGMSTREIAATTEDLYGAEVSPSLISKVTEPVIDDVIAWQARHAG